MSLAVLLLVATVREPQRRRVPDGQVAARGSGPIACVRYVLDNFGLHGNAILGLSIGAIVFNGLFAWVPSHFIRVFHWSAGEIGMAFGLILLTFGTAGMWCGGLASDKAASAGRRNGPITVVFWGETLGGCSAMLFGFMPTPFWALASMCVCVFSFGAAIALGPVALQNITPSEIRSQMIALYLFVVNVLGLGIGPTLIAGTSDYVLRNEMAIGKAVSLVAVLVTPFTVMTLIAAKRRYT
jgi:hypothetical protein